MRLTFALPFALCLVGGCHSDQDARNAAALGMTPDQYRKMERDVPLFREFMHEPDVKTETRQFLDRVKKRQKPKELQDWAQQILDEHKSDTNLFSIPQAQLPKFVLNLDPPIEPFVTVFPGSHVAIHWGGGFGHWGLFVGNAEPPDNPIDFMVEWVPGIYAFHDLQ